MQSLTPYAVVLGAPLVLWLLFALFRWRYLRLVRRTIYPAVPTAPPEREIASDPSRATEVTLNWIDASAAASMVQPERLHAALHETRRMRWLLAVSGGVYVAGAAAFVWYGHHLAGRPYNVAISLAYFSTLSGVFVIVAFCGRTVATWFGAALGWLAAAFVLLVGPLGVPWRRALGATMSGVDYGFSPLPSVALLVPRAIRPLLVGFVPLVGFWAVLTVAFVLLIKSLGGTIEQVQNVRGFVWLTGLGAAVIGIGLTVWQIRRGLRPWYIVTVIALIVVWIVGLRFRVPLAVAFLGGIGSNSVFTLIVWVLFSAFLKLKARGLLPDEMLHFAFCWLVVTGFLPLMADAGWNNVALVLLPFGLCVVVLVLTTASHRPMGPRNAPARMLLLRVFGREPRSRLVDLLDDSWRRIGRVDLVVGVDLAVRTVSALALEGFLLGRVNRQLLDSIQEADERLAELPDARALDGRYPLNELHCSADVWQHVVTALALDAHVVLLDLRGFQATNTGAMFELSLVIERVRLARIVLLTNKNTDEAMVADTVQRTWQRLPESSANARLDDPSVDVLRCVGPRSLVDKAIANCVFRAAERVLTPTGLSAHAG